MPMAQARTAGSGQAQPSTPKRRSLALAAFVPPSVRARPSRSPQQYDPGEPERRGFGPWRRAVPYQLLRLPQLRGCRRRTAQRQVRAVADRLDPNVHLYAAMLTGPQQMPVFSDEVLTPEDKRAIIGYLEHAAQPTHRGGLATWWPGSGERGPVGVDHRSR